MAGGSAKLNDVADYICIEAIRAGAPISVLKLHKLLYYVQAWHLAFFEKPMMPEQFQAWVHGPVSRTVYDRFKNIKLMYSPIIKGDLQQGALIISAEAKRHIDSVLEVYMQYSATQLEELTHQEDPWIKAREGYGPTDRCEVPIDEKLMGSFYRKRVA
jgi:uncharacterized phage-associated protein